LLESGAITDYELEMLFLPDSFYNNRDGHPWRENLIDNSWRQDCNVALLMEYPKTTRRSTV
jgi:hypothetical protein